MEQKIFKSCIAAGFTAVGMLGMSGPASAQRPDGQPQPPGLDGSSARASEGRAELEEVIVTAERREEDLQHTAVSVSVRSGEDLLQQGRFSLAQIVEDVPNIVIAPLTQAGTSSATDTPATAISIRGVGSNGRTIGSGPVVSAVALYVDGINNGLGSNYDIKNVQVLRGPQGTLYGRSATAGVVTIQTNDPELARFAGNAAVETGNYDLLHYTGAVNIPIGETLALRISGNQYQQDGYYSRVGGQIDTTDGRIKLLFKPNERLSLLLGYALQNNKESSGGNQGVQAPDGSVDYNTKVPVGTGEDRTRQYWAQLDWDLGPAILTYLPALRTFDQHSVIISQPAAGVLATTPESFPTDNYHTQELRITSNASSKIRWQGGLFYYDNHQTYVRDVSATSSAVPFPLFNNTTTSRRTRDAGVFGEATFPFADTWRLTSGARYDYTKVQSRGTRVSNINATFTPQSLTLDEDQGTRDWTNWTYKLRIEHDLTARNMLYAAVTSGFLPGDTFITNVDNQLVPSEYAPETLTSFEIGSKNRFFDDRLQVNGGVFYYRYGGYQQPVQTGLVSGIALFSVETSPARMLGAELEAIFQLTSADKIALNVGYIDPYYVDKSAVFASGITQSHVPGIPPWTVDPSYSHTFRLSQKQSLRFQAQAHYQSAYDVSAIPDTNAGQEFYYRNKAEVTGNLYLTWQYTRYTVTGYMRNVSDERFKTSVGTISVSPAGPTGAAILSAPRTYGVVISAGF